VSILYSWVEFGTLVDQPPSPWDGVSNSLQAVPPAQFKSGAAAPVLFQDAGGNGAAATAFASSGSLNVTWPSAAVVPLAPELQPPIAVLYNLLQVTQGKTVTNEVIGSGDATVAGQSFTLSKTPVTYLVNGATYASTISLTVNGQPWTEVANFYGQPADAQVFVTSEDPKQITHITYGDGINGARLPTGTNNVVATYRYGAGASIPAGSLTVLAQSYPGLRAILNPVAVSGGSGPDPASLIKQYAPRSVLAFGRAVSVFDHQVLAAQAPQVSMASAQWSWDADNQRAGVLVYVAPESEAASVQTMLSAAVDPNRPVTVKPAIALTVTLAMSLIVTAGMDTSAIVAGVQSALNDPQTGLFSPPQINIGQPVFDSAIDAAVLAVSGVVAIQSNTFAVDGTPDAGPLHVPGEGNYYTLDPGFTPAIGGTQ
jgi:predicted phage baseplate assembly protein